MIDIHLVLLSLPYDWNDMLWAASNGIAFTRRLSFVTYNRFKFTKHLQLNRKRKPKILPRGSRNGLRGAISQTLGSANSQLLRSCKITP